MNIIRAVILSIQQINIKTVRYIHSIVILNIDEHPEIGQSITSDSFTFPNLISESLVCEIIADLDE